ncbi:uracil DNA glycosylase [Tritrichomonas musculus]|uniref:Uracil-DNA glycosylase n=1 Tax=Tritrichomonas musculus TaxID=1915356 RepID=A0ABR2L6C8_9EUKA
MKQSTLNFAVDTKSSKPKKKIEPVPEEPQKEWNENPDYDKIFDSPDDFKNCLEPSWREALSAEFTKPYFNSLLQSLRKDTRTIFPPKCDILNAFKYCPFNRVKVVIIGQDPYHEIGQAHGLAFSVKKGVKIPPSLVNIYKEIHEEYPDFKIPNHGYLESWANQGILMLNATLTVAKGEADSHSSYGWHNFTNAAINAINKKLSGIIFVAWGNSAKKICQNIDVKKHKVLKSGHPSPLSVRFFTGCGHFKKINEILLSEGKTPIRWDSVNDS